MNHIEIGGQSCSGKTTLIKNFLDSKKKYVLHNNSYPIKFVWFFCGLKYLGIKRSTIIFSWSFNETASYFFRLNIFINAISKFGLKSNVFFKKSSSNSVYIIDEGISHLPFLFLNTDPNRTVDFIKDDIDGVEVHFLKSPGAATIKNRINERGHRRLTFIAENAFIERNHQIEEVLLSLYPNLFKRKFTII